MSLLNVSRSLKARTHADIVDPKEVTLFIVSLVRTEQYCAVALMTVLVYHSVLTLKKEVKYFWRNLRSSVSIIYFANRYIGLLAAVGNMTASLFSKSHASLGLFSFWVTNLTSLLIFFLIDYILLIRTMALFHRNKTLSIVLKFLLGVEICISSCLFIYTIWFADVGVSSLAEGLSFCLPRRSPPRSLFIFSWMAALTTRSYTMALSFFPVDIDFADNGAGNEESSEREGAV
ncbi:hypothetical protein ACEPAG_2772 [Sanghuangporus baumii]